MPASSIAVYFDTFKDRLSHQLPSGEALAVITFNFQRVEEALSTGVVVAIIGATHAAYQSVLVEQGLIDRRAVL